MALSICTNARFFERPTPVWEARYVLVARDYRVNDFSVFGIVYAITHSTTWKSVQLEQDDSSLKRLLPGNQHSRLYWSQRCMGMIRLQGEGYTRRVTCLVAACSIAAEGVLSTRYDSPARARFEVGTCPRNNSLDTARTTTKGLIELFQQLEHL